MLWGFNCLNRIRRNNEDTLENQLRNVGPERAPLLPQKDDDLSSLGSSYDSGSQSGEEYQDLLEEGPCDGRPGGEGGKKYQPRQLCVICYDAPKDCFFIPCGHCASCFDCGVRYMLILILVLSYRLSWIGKHVLANSRAKLLSRRMRGREA